MSIKTHNNYAWSAMQNAESILDHGPQSKGLKQRIKKIWKLYIDRYFYNDESLWDSRKQPYIFYKHLFRKFLYKNITQNKEQLVRYEEFFSGTKPHHTTIYNSLDQDVQHFPIQEFIIEDINNFLEENLEMTLDSQVRQLVQQAKGNGYLNDDIARNCYVHPEVIEDLLQGKDIPTNILNQMKREMT